MCHVYDSIYIETGAGAVLHVYMRAYKISDAVGIVSLQHIACAVLFKAAYAQLYVCANMYVVVACCL
jgi:hypothetical protein